MDMMKFYDLMNGDNDCFRQKIKVVSKREVQGKNKVDKDGKPVVNEETGEIDCWDNSYYLEYLSLTSGGSHTCRITQEQFCNDSIKVGETYLASGKIDYVTYKDSYNSTPRIIFNSFQNFRDFIELEMSNVTFDQKSTEVKTTSKVAK